MKAALLVTYIFMATFRFASCDKSSKAPASTTKTPEEIITANAWKIDEIRFLQDDIPYYYKRGAKEGNTQDFDDEFIQFKSDKTGTYRINHQDYALTWNFANADKTILKYTIQYPRPLAVTWEHIIYKNNSIMYSEVYQHEVHSLAYAIRIPR